jgi:hypothetical protein
MIVTAMATKPEIQEIYLPPLDAWEIIRKQRKAQQNAQQTDSRPNPGGGETQLDLEEHGEGWRAPDP